MTENPLRIVFFGTPAFAVPTLDALLHSRHTVVGVVTQPDRPRGRGHKLSDAPVKARAVEAALPILQPERMKDVGFTMSLPAYFGALPWVGSNIAISSPMLAPGATPSPPIKAAHASDR